MQTFYCKRCRIGPCKVEVRDDDVDLPDQCLYSDDASDWTEEE